MHLKRNLFLAFFTALASSIAVYLSDSAGHKFSLPSFTLEILVKTAIIFICLWAIEPLFARLMRRRKAN
ncbi:MAG: hypothetical protein JSS82_07635 [Bacteroidetes bacterium]|nr:hypothetical protein [Bacteroidota bacterium]